MSAPESVPEWLGAGVLGAVIAALGYVFKLFIDVFKQWRSEAAARRAQLLELRARLQASRALFATQRSQCALLAGRIRERLGAEAPSAGGFDRLFAAVYANMNPDERDLHSIIRGMTEHAMRQVNLSMKAWLAADRTFK